MPAEDPTTVPLATLVRETHQRYRTIAHHYASGLPNDEPLDRAFDEHARLLGVLNQRLLYAGERLTELPPGTQGNRELLDFCLSVFGEREYCLLDHAPARPSQYFSPFSFVPLVQRFTQDVRLLQGQRIARWLGDTEIERGYIAAEVQFSYERSGRIYRRALYVPLHDRQVFAEGSHDQGVLAHWNLFDPVMANLSAYGRYTDENAPQGRVWRTDWAYHHPELTAAHERLPPDHIVRMGDALVPG